MMARTRLGRGTSSSSAGSSATTPAGARSSSRTSSSTAAVAPAALARARAPAPPCSTTTSSSSICAATTSRVATADDPATARFGETLPRRSSGARCRRNSAAPGGSIAASVLAGLAVEAALRRRHHRRRRLASALRRLPLAGVQRRHRARGGQLLRALGPRRAAARAPAPRDAWDTDSWLTHYTLIGLSRHADHHAHAARPFERLRAVDESPKLPGGYYAMVGLAQMRNKRFRALMTAELRRRKLGPFVEAGSEADG